MNEIERKWKVKYPPLGYDFYPRVKLLAVYFEDVDGKDIRFRKEGNKYFKVKKLGSGISRNIGPNGDVRISKEEFHLACRQEKVRKLWKTRYYIPYGKYTIHFDIYRDFKNFYTIEVEFNTVKEAKKFVPPVWFGKEVTNNRRYSSNYLATYGLIGNKRKKKNKKKRKKSK